MYDWLREELEKCLAEHPRTQWTAITPYAFINWLERTGATLSVGRVGPLQETPMLVLPDEYYENVEGE